ncbi:TetR/AcrR family transcriptional regulator [Allosphingosinicella deserti]|uniref:TetR/AcrR family transcriptional regulator n=1 Tax=Allosphingosinicella deserti TaxID=2116704 RepID=A0A2P7QIT7_9SPHN|nr:TetR/AcrR family transcriptional regulator [Sphingomonas deserti]PSJ37895.1 TetR/AcrR family transcriptional regulator [Sphingomonas deserti]
MSERRRSISMAARALFLEKGFNATSIADIRDASGATTGSIYHAFGSKEGIALALVTEAVGAWTRATLDAQRSEDAEGLIRGTVEGLLAWARSDPAGFQILDHIRSLGEQGQAGDGIGAFLKEGRAASRVTLVRLSACGEIAIGDPDLAQALILGPAFEYLRAAGASIREVTEQSAQLLSDAAWSAMKPA